MSKLSIATICILFVLLTASIANNVMVRQDLKESIAITESSKLQIKQLTDSKTSLESDKQILLQSIAKLSDSKEKLEKTNKTISDENYTIKNTKPELPVSVSYRKAMMGPGLVAIISTTIKQPVPVIATFSNPNLGTSKKMEIHLSASSSTEIGHAEGVILENGDTITIENKNYAPATFIVSY